MVVWFFFKKRIFSKGMQPMKRETGELLDCAVAASSGVCSAGQRVEQGRAGVASADSCGMVVSAASVIAGQVCGQEDSRGRGRWDRLQIG